MVISFEQMHASYCITAYCHVGMLCYRLVYCISFLSRRKTHRSNKQHMQLNTNAIYQNGHKVPQGPVDTAYVQQPNINGKNRNNLENSDIFTEVGSRQAPLKTDYT